MRYMIPAVVCIAMLMLAGCGDEEKIAPLLMHPIEETFIAGVLAAPTINTSRPILRVFYVEPKSQPIPPTDADFEQYVKRIDRQVKEVQMLFSNEMTRHGYKGKTFAIQTDKNRRLVVERVKTDNPLSYYLGQDSHAVMREMGERFGNVYDHSRREIRLFFIDLQGAPGCGFGSGGSPNGSAYVFGTCWTNEVIAHELGHAFGLEHDWRNGEYIMSYGSTEGADGEWKPVNRPRTKISRGAAGWLNLHPAISGQEHNLLTYTGMNNFRVISAKRVRNSNKHAMHVAFDSEYFPKGHDLHDYSLNSILHYAVFLDIDNYGANVIRYVGKNAFKHKIISRRELGDTGPIVVNRIKYEMRFEAELPHDVQAIQLQFMSRQGHWEIVNAIDWTP